MDAKYITTSIFLKGKRWEELSDAMVGKIFDTNYKLFVLCASIGIMKDETTKISLAEDEGDVYKEIARSVLIKNLNDIDFLFSTAIITTKTLDYTIDERLRLAFSDEETSFKKMKFLEEFANTGLEDMYNCISNNELEMMDNLKELFDSLKKHNYLFDIELDSSSLCKII